jgi:hypothetical protein
MKVHFFLTILIASALALSGCIADDGPEPLPDTDADPATPTPTPLPSQPPAQSGGTVPPLTVALEASNTTGEAPFAVTFQISSESRDASYLDWSLDADGDGVIDKTGYGLPAEAAYTFADAGDYTAIVRVEDVEGRAANASLALAIVAPEAVTLPEPIVFEGVITGVADGDGGYVAGEDVTHAFNVSVLVSKMTVAFAVGDTALDLDFTVLRPDGEVANRTAKANEPTGTFWPKADPPIVIHEAEHLGFLGTWAVVVHPFTSYEGTYTITITFE